MGKPELGSNLRWEIPPRGGSKTPSYLMLKKLELASRAKSQLGLYALPRENGLALLKVTLIYQSID